MFVQPRKRLGASELWALGLEGTIDFSATSPLTADARARARRRLYHVVQHFETAETGAARRGSQRGIYYNRPLLVRLTYEYARSEESRDVFLVTLFRSMALDLDYEDTNDDDIDVRNEHVEERLRTGLYGFAEYLVDNFFLPLKASSNRTPQPLGLTAGTCRDARSRFDRVSALRGACLIRDRRRCVVSRRFDIVEAIERIKADGDDARYDDGLPLNNVSPFDRLEVAHILPHSLTKVDPDALLNPSREAALAILNMFDVGIVYLIEGAEIDRPQNAITLTSLHHHLFGNFNLFFEPVPGQPPHTSRIDSFFRQLVDDPRLPITRTLYLAEVRTIDPPSARLLAIHYAIAHILYLSAAGGYIDRILRDAAENGIRPDGSTELGRLVNLGHEFGLTRQFQTI
ncbi:hypothetical protein B0T26DRAFT_736936 [Lasiosphaeria miniovina]|uniref:HNH nuclease domain-containing protein n=1 Tax=Lasiosphaeria miniovina TaxID=1954250 RepID=A0AA40EDB7_9PEZI|nr:uncharacterized protein B0T26DRAFT_736936 [Lasiosphaeria miniovina]KAK0734182.1 hypothetical protein B0T26DRAFT_736936 [Lasiosphaeria miniovina]